MASTGSPDGSQNKVAAVTLAVKATAEDFAQVLQDARNGKRAEIPVEAPDGTMFMMTIGQIVVASDKDGKTPAHSWKGRGRPGDPSRESGGLPRR